MPLICQENSRACKHILKGLVDKAFYVPCAGHSLNLVGVHTVESCLEAINFFGFQAHLENGIFLKNS